MRRFVTFEVRHDIPTSRLQEKRFRGLLVASFHSALGDVKLINPAMGFRWHTAKRRGHTPRSTDVLVTLDYLYQSLSASRLISGMLSGVLESSIHEAEAPVLELSFRYGDDRG
jgi:hypothetical protein